MLIFYVFLYLQAESSSNPKSVVQSHETVTSVRQEFHSPKEPFRFTNQIGLLSNFVRF